MCSVWLLHVSQWLEYSADSWQSFGIWEQCISFYLFILIFKPSSSDTCWEIEVCCPKCNQLAFFPLNRAFCPSFLSAYCMSNISSPSFRCLTWCVVRSKDCNLIFFKSEFLVLFCFVKKQKYLVLKNLLFQLLVSWAWVKQNTLRKSRETLPSLGAQCRLHSTACRTKHELSTATIHLPLNTIK